MSTPDTSLFDRVPPQDLEAERSVLGSCLLQSEVIDDVLLLITGEQMFYSDAHQKLWRAMLSMYEAGIRGIDAVTLGHELDRRGELEAVGGPPYIVQVLETVPHAAHAEYYARIVRDKSQQRSLIDACTEIIKESYDSPDGTEDIIAKAGQRIDAVVQGQVDRRIQTMADAQRDCEQRLQAESTLGITTGFPTLDNLLGAGLEPGTLTVVGARPSFGKTALVWGMAADLSEAGHHVYYAHLEQRPFELMQRYAAAETGVPVPQIRRREIDEAEREALLRSFEIGGRLPISMTTGSHQTMQMISATARLLSRRHELSLVVIDYLQKVSPGPRSRNSTREQQVAEIASAAKDIAVDLNVPVLLAAQLNRSVEQGGYRTPRLSDLRESGRIEQDADNVVMIDRRGAVESECNPREATLIVAKNRSGATGKVKVAFNLERVRFREEIQVPEDF